MLTRCTELPIRFWTPFCSTKFYPQAVETDKPPGRLTEALISSLSLQLQAETTRSRSLGVPKDTDTFLHWGMWQHCMHLNTFYIYPPFGTSCSDVFSTVFPYNIFHEFSRFPTHHFPIVLHHGCSFHPYNLPQGLLWRFLCISRSSTTLLCNFHVRLNEWNTDMHEYTCELGRGRLQRLEVCSLWMRRFWCHH